MLFDGWALVREAGTPAALHQAAALPALDRAVEAILALPEAAAGLEWLPDTIEHLVLPAEHSPWGRLAWEQRTLPQAARQCGAQILFLSGSHAPLISPVPHLVSPAGWSPGSLSRQVGLASRLRAALGRGGLSRAQAVLWPDDLPTPGGYASVQAVPPLIHPSFRPPKGTFFQASWPGFDLPEAYILYHGPLDPASAGGLLEAWSWAAGPIGTYFPLVVCGAVGTARPAFEAALRETALLDSIILLPGEVSNPAHYASLYQGCTALLHLAWVSPWGDPVRHILACGKPVIAAANNLTEALVGPAGYLVPAGDHRQMGAALITLCVENEMAEDLGRQAAQRAQGWTSEAYRNAVLKTL